MGLTSDGVLAAAIISLSLEQDRVAVLGESLSSSEWNTPPSDEIVDALIKLGHFDEYAVETEWSACQVVGHLTDSALILADRVDRILSQEEPLLADFVTDEPERLERYRLTSPDAALRQLGSAQQGLQDALHKATEGDLDRRARHEVDGAMTLADIVQFLPGHQRDHAEQLALLTRKGGD